MTSVRGQLLILALLGIFVNGSFGILIKFTVSARNLQLMDQFIGNALPDTYASLSERTGKFSEDGIEQILSTRGVGETYTIDNDQNPVWNNEFSVNYNPGSTHYIVVKMVDVDFCFFQWCAKETMGYAIFHVQALHEEGSVGAEIWDGDDYIGTTVIKTK